MKRDPEDLGVASMTSQNDRTWTFLTNHARVLILIAQTPDIRLRDIAARIGITERATQRIVGELEADGYLSHKKEGRRNRYSLHPDAHLRHPLENEIEIGQLIDFISSRAPSGKPTAPS
ncbi:MAG: helix-turn-helix transcriptional regulator [Acidimicrobiia bacterium]